MCALHILRATLVPIGFNIQLILIFTCTFQNQDPQAPPVKKRKVSDSEDDVVIDLGEEKKDDNLKELLIQMEKTL